jgi:hypothetical protein
MSKAFALVAALLLLPLAVLSFRFLGAAPAEDHPPEVSDGLAAYEAAVSDEQYALRGIVYSRSGRDSTPLPGATVWLAETVDGVTRDSVVTNPDGVFGFMIAEGAYVLGARLEGWRCDPVGMNIPIDEQPVVIDCEPWPPERARDVTVVRLSVDDDDIVAVDPDPLYIGPGDCVLWFSTDGPWAVHFSPISPLAHRRIRGTGEEPEGGCARDDIFPGKYSYFVAVQKGDFIYTEDPELIDENEN